MSVAMPVPQKSYNERTDTERRRQPRYHVRLWDDNQHTFLYVIRMLRELFGHNMDKAKQLAVRVDSSGSAICLTTTKEHAELKREQILAYGRDKLIASCAGSMGCSIEPED